MSTVGEGYWITHSHNIDQHLHIGKWNTHLAVLNPRPRPRPPVHPFLWEKEVAFKLELIDYKQHKWSNEHNILALEFDYISS